jgi:hypothetical protein
LLVRIEAKPGQERVDARMRRRGLDSHAGPNSNSKGYEYDREPASKFSTKRFIRQHMAQGNRPGTEHGPPRRLSVAPRGADAHLALDATNLDNRLSEDHVCALHL